LLDVTSYLLHPKLKGTSAHPSTLKFRVEVDNNLIENSIRPLALGRKNYLFAGSHRAAQRAAMMYTFFASCQKLDVNPRLWLADVLERIADHPINRLEE